MPQGFFGYIPTKGDVWFVNHPWVDGLVNKQMPQKLGRNGKWNFAERGELKKKLQAANNEARAKLKAANFKVAPHYMTEAAARTVVERAKAIGVQLEVVKGAYL